MKPNNVNGDVKLLTEKACKFISVVFCTRMMIDFCFIDSKLFQVRRKESKELLGIIMNEEKYERKYKLIEAACDKILKVCFRFP